MMHELIQTIRESVIGEGTQIRTPYGVKTVCYADYTASGRSLTFIENFIKDLVLPNYANTHTEASGTGLQTTHFRQEAREIIRKSVGATSEHAVIFTGSGATAAINRLIQILGIRYPESADLSELSLSKRPVVFIGPYEHHSNEISWRETIAEVITIPEDDSGQIDQTALLAALEKYPNRPKIGAFSAASNVTGILSNIAEISALLHQHGALSCWDFAAAAPYIEIDLQQSQASDPAAYLDAIFISTHKFIGGPASPGLLVARKELFTNKIPSQPGGGTVAYVNPEDHVYLDDIETREEGGTPAIIESIRAGLVFDLKNQVGVKTIKSRENALLELAFANWAQHPKIKILGNREAERLSIVSFMIKTNKTQYLHHNFVVALLNDLFGIQARGGCSCAGPYGHRLLGIDLAKSHEFEQEIGIGCEGIKPGWVRINFNYFLTDETAEYLIAAVNLIAEHGWKLLDDYCFNPSTGLWQHQSGLVPPAYSLTDLSYQNGQISYPPPAAQPEIKYQQQLVEASAIFTQPQRQKSRPETSAHFEKLRWFPISCSDI